MDSYAILIECNVANFKIEEEDSASSMFISSVTIQSNSKVDSFFHFDISSDVEFN
jgi:hypothetical protein